MSFQVHDFSPLASAGLHPNHVYHSMMGIQSPRDGAKARHMQKNFPVDALETCALRLWEGEERLFQLSQKSTMDETAMAELRRIIRLLQSLIPDPTRSLDLAQRLFSLLLHQVIAMLSRTGRTDAHDFAAERSILWNLRNSLSSFQPMRACG